RAEDAPRPGCTTCSRSHPISVAERHPMPLHGRAAGAGPASPDQRADTVGEPPVVGQEKSYPAFTGRRQPFLPHFLDIHHAPAADLEVDLLVVEVILPALADRGAAAVLQLHDPVRLAAGLADHGARAVARGHHGIAEAEREIGHRRHHGQGQHGRDQQSHVLLPTSDPAIGPLHSMESRSGRGRLTGPGRAPRRHSATVHEPRPGSGDCPCGTNATRPPTRGDFAQPPSRSSTATSSGASGALSTYGTRPSSSANSIDAACRSRRLSPACSRRRRLTSGSPYLSSPATGCPMCCACTRIWCVRPVSIRTSQYECPPRRSSARKWLSEGFPPSLTCTWRSPPWRRPTCSGAATLITPSGMRPASSAR